MKSFQQNSCINYYRILNSQPIIIYDFEHSYCAILHKEASHGRANFATGGGFSRPGGVGTVYKINILTGRLIPHNRDADEHEGIPDVAAIAQHPKYPFRFAIADVEGKIYFVDWHGIRDAGFSSNSSPAGNGGKHLRTRYYLSTYYLRTVVLLTSYAGGIPV